MYSSFRRFALARWKQFRPYLLFFAIIAPLKSAVVDWNWVPSASMAPSIVPLEMILVNKLSYGLRLPFTTHYLTRWDDPHRGDVVVFLSPADEERLVKRVLGLPGDVVEMRDERLLINGSAITYGAAPSENSLRALAGPAGNPIIAIERLPGRSHPIMILPGMTAVRTFGPVTIPAGQFFVLGDNRDNSNDSRFIGPIERRRILGRVTTVMASADLTRYGLPRVSRFFTSIQ